MTALVLIQRRIFSHIEIPALSVRLEDYLGRVNGRGVLSGFLMILIATGIVGYVALLIMTFDIGIRLQDVSAASEGQEVKLRQMEILEYQRQAEFRVRHQEYLVNMEKISTVKYLAPEGVAVSRAGNIVAQ